jgi:hypothetical protein
MTPDVYDQIVHTLRREAKPLSTLHALAADAGSTWSVEQLHLMLACMDGIEITAADSDDPVVQLGQRSPQEELVEAIVDVLRAQGRAIPAAQVIQLLPSRFATSIEQIKKLARESRGLKVMGPGLIGLD